MSFWGLTSWFFQSWKQFSPNLSVLSQSSRFCKNFLARCFQSSADLNLLKFVGESPASCLPFCSTDLRPLCKCSWDTFWALWGLLWNLTLKLFSVSSLAPPSCSTDLRAVCESPRAQNPLVGALHPPPDTNPPIIRDQKYRTKNAECESQKPKTHFWCLLLPNHFFNDGSKFPFQP